MRRKVATAKAGGMPEEQIALALGITRPTLQKHFMVELTTGAAVRKMEAMDALFVQAKKGNIAAIKLLLVLNGTAGGPPAQEDSEPAKPAAAPAAPPVRLGKKEQAQLAAQTATEGTDWEGLLPGSRSVQ